MMALILFSLSLFAQARMVDKPASETIDTSVSVTYLIASSDGKFVAGSQGTDTIVWSLRDKSEVARLSGRGIGFLPSGNILAIQNNGLAILGGPLWKDDVAHIAWPDEAVWRKSLRFGWDQLGKRVAFAHPTADDRSRVSIVAVEGSSALRESGSFLADCPKIGTMAVSKQGLVAIICESGGTVAVYSTSGDLLELFEAADIPAPSPGGYDRGELLFVGKDRYLVTSYFDSRLRAWNLETQKAVALPPVSVCITGLLPSREGAYLLVLGFNHGFGTLTFWQLPEMRPLGQIRGEFGANGAMALAREDTWIVDGIRTYVEDAEFQDGSIRPHRTRTPCLRIFDWQQILRNVVE